MGQTFTLKTPNTRRIIGTKEDDIIQGSRAHPSVTNGRAGVINLLAGNDTIRSTSNIKIFGEALLGKGRDTVTGSELIYLYAVDNRNGNLFTGSGPDTIEAEDGQLRVGEDSQLNTADGNDRIEVNEAVLIGGSISTEIGNDQIHAGTGGITMSIGGITMGDGDDSLRSEGRIWMDDASINMGKGNDSVNAATAGSPFPYSGRIKLGPGNDRITGCTSTSLPDKQIEPVIIQGGRGTDTLILAPGRYTITQPPLDSSSDTLKGISQISGQDSLLLVSGINRLEGVNGGESGYDFGTFLVNENGIGSFNS